VDPRLELADLARQTRDYLRYMASLGVARLPRVDPPADARPEPVPDALNATPIDAPTPAPAAGTETLEDIRADLGDCRRCPLAAGRAHIVFGEGHPRAGLMFVGEGPGRDEDMQGRPFVGRAGALLTDIIVKGIQMPREDCYIANVVKCRPPENRDPLPDEAAACLPFLRRQIAAVRPRVIVALGRVAAQYLLDTQAPLAKLRHRFHDFQGIPLMPTYHPAYVLRNPTVGRRGTWEDIKLVIDRLNRD